jgi:class 3 adenylate cyclase
MSPDRESLRFVLCVDMSRFSRAQAVLLAAAGSEAVESLDRSIRQIVEGGTRAAGREPREAVLKWTGDGALLLFDEAIAAHEVAVAIQHEAKRYNDDPMRSGVAPDHRDLVLRCFRAGIAAGELTRQGDDYSGVAISEAVRLEAGGVTGEVRISPRVHAELAPAIQQLYGAEEDIPGKAHDGRSGMLRCHRYVVTSHAPWEDPPPPPAKRRSQLLTECFVITPIAPREDRVNRVFDELIAPACRKAGFEPRRAHEIRASNRMDVITSRLESAPMVVAYLGRPDVSSSTIWNPNLMIEVGFRLATQLPIVLLSDPAGSRQDGVQPNFSELLPFHLKHLTVTEIGAEPAASVEVLSEEIDAAKQRHPGYGATPHAVIEALITASEQKFLEVSPAAVRLFGGRVEKGASLDSLIQALSEMMPPQQYRAFTHEQERLLDELLRPRRFRLTEAREDAETVPVATVPIQLRRSEVRAPVPGWAFFLPVVLHFTGRDTVHRLRVLYLDVTSAVRRGPDGTFVCRLAAMRGSNDPRSAAAFGDFEAF